MLDLLSLSNRLEAIENKIREKITTGYIEISVKVNYISPLYLTISLPENVDCPVSSGRIAYEEELELKLQKLKTWANKLPSPEEVEKMRAARNLGQAIDKAREAGLDVEALSVSFQGIWENLIEDKSDD